MKKLNDQKFCSWCGGNVEYIHEWVSKCHTCKYVNYINHKPCCNVIIRKNNHILMLERAIEPMKGLLDLPGGFVDITDQSIEDACYREIQEEIGINEESIGPLKYIDSKTEFYLWQDIKLHNLCFYFEANLSQDVSLSLDTKENSKFIWVNETQLKSVKYAWDTDRQVLDKYIKEIK